MRLLSVVLLAAVAATASAAQAPDLTILKVSNPPKRVGAGDDFVVAAKFKNIGEKRLGGKVKMHLTGGRGDYAVPRRIGRFPLARLDPGAFRRYTVRLTVPDNVGAGRYRLQTCVKAKRQPLVCDVSRRFRVTG